MDKALLAVIVCGAFVARALLIWIGRPEFVGWFNHSTYYWVQVKGLLQNGQLPYADLPLLFFLQAGVARGFQLFGMEVEASIVNSARLLMSIVPALIAYPVYCIVRGIHGRDALGSRQWVLVALSAFLPLTFVHMPELLQKNVLGLLTLSGLMYASWELLRSHSLRWLIGVCSLFTLIALTHLGTLAVALLFGLALLLSSISSEGLSKQALAILLLVVGFSVAGVAGVYLLDGDAFARILRYAKSSVSNSLVGGLFSPAPASQRLLFLLGILAPLGVVVWYIRMFRDHRMALSPSDRLFWLGNMLLVYLLVFPFFDIDVVPRLVLFIPLPLLVVLSYQLRYHESRRTNRLAIGLASLSVAAMLLGEVVDLIMRYPDKAAMHEELVNLREQFQLSEHDFVLTPYAVNTISNWFLGTRAGLITSFNENDRASYDRLFVLNPRESRRAEARPTGVEGTTYRTAEQKYVAMRQSIPLPADLPALAATDHLEFHELHAMPENWLFDPEGNWMGWKVNE